MNSKNFTLFIGKPSMDGSVILLSQARDEFMNNLQHKCVPLFMDGLSRMVKDVLRHAKDKGEDSRWARADLVEILQGVPTWNSYVVQQETQRMEKVFQNLNNYLTAIFLIKTRIMSCVPGGDMQGEMSLEIPKNETFVHSVYRSLATRLMRRTYLFQHFFPEDEDEYLEHDDTTDVSVLHALIQRCVCCAIDDLLPIDEILSTFLGPNVNVNKTFTPTPHTASGFMPATTTPSIPGGLAAGAAAEPIKTPIPSTSLLEPAGEDNMGNGDEEEAAISEAPGADSKSEVAKHGDEGNEDDDEDEEEDEEDDERDGRSTVFSRPRSAFLRKDHEADVKPSDSISQVGMPAYKPAFSAPRHRFLPPDDRRRETDDRRRETDEQSETKSIFVDPKKRYHY